MEIKRVTRQGESIVFEFADKVGMEYPSRQSVVDMVADLESDVTLKRKQEIAKWAKSNLEKLGGE